MRKPVCVQHRDGWCATKRTKVPKEEEDDNEPTLCGYFVVLPYGFDRRTPTCPDCKKIIKEGA